MNKRIVSLLCLIMALIMSFASLSGCKLVTIDNQEDLDQVIATVKINNEEKAIYKKDLIMQYLNVGYVYTQSYGYTLEKTYNLLFDNLVTSVVMTQAAMQKFEEEENVLNADAKAYSPERYLDDEAITNALYATRSSVDSLLKSALETEDTKYQDTLIDTVRAVPTGATNKTVELTLQEKKDFNSKAFDISSTAEKRDAFNEIVDLLRVNGLLEDLEEGVKFNGTLESTAFYKRTYQSNLENQVLLKLEKELELGARKTLTFEELEAHFIEELNAQKEWDNAEFVDGIKNASVSSPMLYSKFGNYGYVYNLLLGVNDEQTDEIEEYKKDNPNASIAEYEEARKSILSSTLIKDQRASWILSNYDTALRGNDLVFTGDYTFANDINNSLAFQGEFKEIEPANAEEKTPAKYTVTDTTVFGLNEFITFMDSYLGGVTTDNKSAYETKLGFSVYGAKKLEGVSEYKEKMNELLFAFSTDDGSLNTYQGYVIKPEVDGSNSEEFVRTFGDAGRILLEQGEGYVIVASDFGYHVMFYSKLFKANTAECNNLVEFLNKESNQSLTREEWISKYNERINGWQDYDGEEDYLYHTVSSLTDVKVTNSMSELEREIINTNRYEESDKVVIYKDRFSDLWK